MVKRTVLVRYLAVLLFSFCLARAGLHDSRAIRSVLKQNSSTTSTQNKSLDERNAVPISYGEKYADVVEVFSSNETNGVPSRKDVEVQGRSQRVVNENDVYDAVFSPTNRKFQKVKDDSEGATEFGEGEVYFSVLHNLLSDETSTAEHGGDNKRRFLSNKQRRIRSLRSHFEVSRQLSQPDHIHSTSSNFSSTFNSRLGVESLAVRNDIYEPHTTNNDISSNQDKKIHLFDREEEGLKSHSLVSEIQNDEVPPIPSRNMRRKSTSTPTYFHQNSKASVPDTPELPEATKLKRRLRQEFVESLGRTTSHREALVRASLITEDRNFHLKMLPRNKMVGLTLEPHTRHRLMFPVERSGFLSLSLAPCGEPVQWSLTMRSLPPQSATQEALSREGQDAVHPAMDHELSESEPPGHSIRESAGDRRGVVMLAARRRDRDGERTKNVLGWREHSSEDIFPNAGAAGNGNVKEKKGEMPVEPSLSENDVLFQGNDKPATPPGNNTKLTQMDVPVRIVNQSKTYSKLENDNFETTSGIGNRRQSRIFIPEDKYKQSDSLKSILSDEFRKTNSNVYSLKNLAYDIGRSDFFENEINQIRYHTEYEEVLRSNRERRDTRFTSRRNPIRSSASGTEHSSVYNQVPTARCQTNDTLCSKSSRRCRYVSTDSVREEIWFEDPIHSNWFDGNYTDDTQFDSTGYQDGETGNCSKLDNQGSLQNVIFIPSRHRSRFKKFNNKFKVLESKFGITNNDNDTHGPYLRTVPNSEGDREVKPFSTRPQRGAHISMLEYGYTIKRRRSNNTKALKLDFRNKDYGHQMNLTSESLTNLKKSGNHRKSTFQTNNLRVSRSVQESPKTSELLPSAYIVLNIHPRRITSETTPKEPSNLQEMRASQNTIVEVPTETTTTTTVLNTHPRQITSETTRKEPSNLQEMRASQTTIVEVPTEITTTTTESPLSKMSIRDIINSIWKRPKLKTTKLLQVYESNRSDVSESQEIASTTIWGRTSTYDQLDSGFGDQVWIFQRRNATPGIYVITVSSGASAVSLQVVASRRPFASYYQPLPVSALVSRRPDEPPILTVSWLASKESSRTTKTKRIQRHREREQKSLQNHLRRRLPSLQRTRKSLLSRGNTKPGNGNLQPLPPDGAWNQTSSMQTKRRRHWKRTSDQVSKPVLKNPSRGDFPRKTYCLALSEVRPHESLCGARASNEPNLKLGCTRQTHYSLPLAPEVYRDDHPRKRYYVTVWQPGSLMPLGQTTLRGSGRGRIPRLRQGVLHRILLSAGGSATARFRVRRSQPRLHVVAVSCRGGLAITVREGGPRGLRVVRAGGRSALILAVRNPPKGLLHLTVTPSTPHTAHTFLIAAATSAHRLPFPRLPQNLTVQADVTSCTSGSLSWQTAPGRPKYCVLLQAVQGRPKIVWPPLQCGWDRLLSDPSSLAHCSVGFKGPRQTWELLRLKENTTYTATVLVTHQHTNRSLSLAPAVLTMPSCN